MTAIETLVSELQYALDQYYLATGRQPYGGLAITADNLDKRLRIIEVIVDNSELTSVEWGEIAELVDDIGKQEQIADWQPLLAKVRAKAGP